MIKDVVNNFPGLQKQYQAKKENEKKVKQPSHRSNQKSEPAEEDDGGFRFPKELEYIFKMNEVEARQELAEVVIRCRQMFILWKIKEVTMK